MARSTKAPRAPEAPSTSPTAGVQATRPDHWRPSLSSWTRGFERAAGHRDRRLDAGAVRVGLDPRVPPIGADQRHAWRRLLVADGIVGAPAARAHQQQIVGGGGHCVGAERRQVLVGERDADERIVDGVAAAPERAEDRWDPSRLDVERTVLEGADPHVERVGNRLLEVLGADLGQERQARVGPPHSGQRQPEHAQRVVLVVGVVEIGLFVAAAHGRRDLAADGDGAMGHLNRPGREGQHQQGRAPAILQGTLGDI